MAKKRIPRQLNFFATAAEIAEWLQEGYARHHFAYAFSGPGWKQLLIPPNLDWDNAKAVRRAVERHTDLLIAIKPLNVTVESVGELNFVNPGSMWVHLPKLCDSGLSYGTIMTGTGDARLRGTRRALIDAFGERTDAGIWIGVPGQEGHFEGNVWYTAGAEALWANGVALRGGGATVVSRLGPV